MRQSPIPYLLALLSSSSLAFGSTTDLSDWYPFESTQPLAESPIGLQDWNQERAGARGPIEMIKDELIYDGAPIRLWGSNLTYDSCAPEKDLADRRAKLYRKLGINSVRLHKYADGGSWAGVMSDNSILEFNPEEIDRMDYFIDVLAENGIYTKLSPNFGVKIQPGDRSRIPWFDEIGSNRDRVDAGPGAIFLSHELQDIQIELMVKFLNRVNPYNGKRYAEDPAIWCVEFFNEDAVLFYATNRRLQGLPTLRKRSARAFSAWLRAKYGDEAAWQAAWGTEAIIGTDGWDAASPHLRNLVGPQDVKGDLPPESLIEGSVVPWGQPYFYDAAMKPDGDMPNLRQRMLDTMVFLTGLQDAFWERMRAAVLETGFEGVLLAGNWQTGNDVPHFMNLYSDYKIGIIDRHNYFPGPRRALRRPDIDLNKRAMVADPGSTLLSSGMQQVVDRPFMLSEWIHEQPSEYYLEGPAILGAYGLGLNGWDVSYIFQNTDDATFTNRLGRDAWDVMIPMIAGTFPAIARQVRRGDVLESPLTLPLKVHPASLLEGTATASTFTVQRGDVKAFQSHEVNNDAMAVARVAVEFTETAETTPTIDLTPHYDASGALVSVTDQLRWMPASDGAIEEGFFTMDTDATVAFVGFAKPGAIFDLGPFEIKPEPGFGVDLHHRSRRRGGLLQRWGSPDPSHGTGPQRRPGIQRG